MHLLSPRKVMFCFAFVILTLSQANGNNIRIFRGERDRFTNTTGCTQANAQCFDQECSYCQCGVKETFVRTRGQNGECVPNEVLVYATSHDASFIVKSDEHVLCIYRVSTYNSTLIYAGSCKTDDLDYRWLWTNTDQLVNMATLECATDGDYNTRGLHYVVLKKCDRNKKQVWACVGGGKYIQQSVTRRYMRYGPRKNYVTTSTSDSIKSKWKRYGTNSENVCSKAVGCERFMDGSSIVNLDRTKCTKHSECTGRKKINLTKARCSLLPSKTQYLHNKTWTPLSMMDGSLVISLPAPNQVFLEWNLNKTSMYWDGLLVKVRFECQNKAETTEHCIVIKYSDTSPSPSPSTSTTSPPSTSTTSPPTTSTTSPPTTSTTSPPPTTTSSQSSSLPTSSSSTSSPSSSLDRNAADDNDQESNGGSDGNTQTIIIVVCLLVVLLLTGVVVFFIYRYRSFPSCRNHFFHGVFTSRKSKEETQEAKSPSTPVEYAESMNPLYPSNKNIAAQKDCELYEPTPDHLYQYVDVEPKTTSEPSRDFTYDYAVNDSLRLKPDATEAAVGDNDCYEGVEQVTQDELSEKSDNNQNTQTPPHYHVLEQP